jgi:hypothetical protein
MRRLRDFAHGFFADLGTTVQGAVHCGNADPRFAGDILSRGAACHNHLDDGKTS